MTIYGIREPIPGPRWQQLFEAIWPAYRAWYTASDPRPRPNLVTAVARLRKHMPELVDTYERMVDLAGEQQSAARMLTLWDPPRYLPGCSQAVLTRPAPTLCRNYDYSPALFECVVYSSEFTGRKVIGTSDCLWGLLDGMNDAGLAISLAFGGQPGSGPGFGIPLVVRYLLEVADTAADAVAALRRVPVSMAYNLTMVDAAGAHVTAFVAPGRAPEVTSSTVATNQRCEIPDYPDHARRFRSVERREHLFSLVRSDPAVAEFGREFLRPPLYSTDFSSAFGTLYTALYRPAEGVVEYLWPDRTWRRTFADPDEQIQIVLREPLGDGE